MICLHSHSPAEFVDIGRLATGALERSLLSTEHKIRTNIRENVDFHIEKKADDKGPFPIVILLKNIIIRRRRRYNE